MPSSSMPSMSVAMAREPRTTPPVEIPAPRRTEGTKASQQQRKRAVWRVYTRGMGVFWRRSHMPPKSEKVAMFSSTRASICGVSPSPASSTVSSRHTSTGRCGAASTVAVFSAPISGLSSDSSFSSTVLNGSTCSLGSIVVPLRQCAFKAKPKATARAEKRLARSVSRNQCACRVRSRVLLMTAPQILRASHQRPYAELVRNVMSKPSAGAVSVRGNAGSVRCAMPAADKPATVPANAATRASSRNSPRSTPDCTDVHSARK
mmetsp:Transcript_15145/g.60828  ORF Transcript_15145/g.60828 Transcript_15145/m.60828 type:complete len:262 (-) Transcript_15145:359-1144(-)